jgi:hypothetical protein
VLIVRAVLGTLPLPNGDLHSSVTQSKIGNRQSTIGKVIAIRPPGNGQSAIDNRQSAISNGRAG